MPEVNVRDCYIHLLDGYKLTVQVKPLQLTSDLMSIIATHLKLKDKEYFGLYYEVSGEYQYWLEPGRPVVEQVPGANLDIIILHFGAMLYQENFKHLQDGVALGLYYIQCQQLIAKNLIKCQHHTLIKLISLVLQAQIGDFTTEQVAIEEGLRENKYLPSSFSCTEYEEYEEDILTQYRQLIGMQRKEAILTYLEIVQELPSYGMHFYDVKDRNDVQKLIGIGLYGISQFNIENRDRPEQVYLWTGISKISSRDNKFILEFRNQALDLDTLLVDENVINSTSQCQSMSAVQSWYSESHQLIRVMEQMAATQLSYFEKRKKFRLGIRLYSATSSTSSISSIGSITISSSACTQKSDSISSMETTQAVRLAGKEHYNALKNRKEELERVIEEKEAELRRIKLQEAKLTGILPDDLTEEEKATLPKQMATTYTLQYLYDSDLFTSMKDTSSNTAVNDPENDKEIKRLSRAFEVQCNIVKAEYKIYKGHYTSKKIKKQRKKNYKASEKKLKELEKELEKRRDALSTSVARQSRFYSGVEDKDSYKWEILASKSFTMPYKNNVLSVVDENKVALHVPNKKAARHSSAVPLKIDPPLMKIRTKHNSNTVYTKRSNASDSISTASPMDGSSFLSLYSRDSSSHLSSGSISSDESRCLSCPATELVIRKHKAVFKNETQKRVSQHLDVALPEKAIKEKKKETIDKLNLDITNKVIFKPSTHYPEPLHASLPFSASIHSARDFYTKSLPLESAAVDTSAFGKYQYTSDQISKQQYQQKLAYTQQNTAHTNRSPSPRVTVANTRYPLPYMRVNSVPYGLHSSKSPSHDQIDNTSHLTHSQTLVTSTNTSYTLDRHPYSYGGTHTHSNGVMKPAVPITRIHTTPNNITTLEYAKPTHYPQGTSPKLKNKNIQARVYTKQDTRLPSTVPVQYQPHIHTQNPASHKYTNPPVCKIQITPPEYQQYCFTQNRYAAPYNHQSTSEDRYILQQPQLQHQRPNYLKTNLHDPLSYTTSLPMPQQQQQNLPPQQLQQQISPSIKNKIDYWEQHTAVQSRPSTSKSLDKIARQSYPPTDTDITPVVKSKSFRNTFMFDNNTPSDEGTPV